MSHLFIGKFNKRVLPVQDREFDSFSIPFVRHIHKQVVLGNVLFVFDFDIMPT